MIRIIVFTNNDEDRRIEFPEFVCCRPMVGDNIESIDGQAVRKICSITHSYKILDSSTGQRKEALLYVEVKR